MGSQGGASGFNVDLETLVGPVEFLAGGAHQLHAFKLSKISVCRKMPVSKPLLKYFYCLTINGRGTPFIC